MKRCTQLLILLASGLASTAQSWCPPGAQWIYNVSDPWINARAQFTYAGDTIVDGHLAQRIDGVYQQTFPMNVVSDWSPIFTRTNGDVVWEWNGAEWDTLYWFSAVPGDSWQPFWPLWDYCPDHAWRVLDTSTTVVSGIALRTLLLEMTAEGEPTGQTQMIYERLGGGIGLSFPRMHTCEFINECFCTFQCYQDQDIIPQGEPCALPLGLLERYDLGPIILPVPASETLTVRMPNQSRLEVVEVFGMDGRKFLSMTQGIGPTTTLDVQQLPNGMYVVHARTGNGLYFTKPVVISR